MLRMKVGCFGWATGFVDGMDNEVLSGGGKLTGCETGVENEEKDVTDGIETELQDPDADTVRASSRKVFFFIEKRTDLRDWSEIELRERVRRRPPWEVGTEAEGSPPCPGPQPRLAGLPPQSTRSAQ